MMRQLQSETNQTEEVKEEGDYEEIICTHLLTPDFEERQTQPAPNHSPQSSPDEDDTSLGAKDFAKGAVVAAAAGVGVPVAATAGLTAIGFTGTGFAAGSIAAGVQAGIGNVVAGSAFATLQSIGATGGFAILGPLGLGAAAVTGVGYVGFRALKTRQNRQRKEKAEEEKQRRKDEEEKQAKKKLLENDGKKDADGDGGITAQRQMCPECRKKNLLKITEKLLKSKF